jgi:tRNA uridine 5-carboxymethylaminomethyl modification enzyme
MKFNYDIIVVGGGHAGCEAAHAAATMGCKVLLVTMDMTKIAAMSCNPAIGGVAKGQMVREIDALGGMTGIITDKTMMQFRMLNRSKGPAMWSPRAQSDRTEFTLEWRGILETNKNIDFWQDAVNGLLISGENVVGVQTKIGIEFFGKKVILTIGTFENGLLHIGSVKLNGGRMADPASYGISKQLADFGFSVGRMKTGTPVRIDGRSVDFSKLDEQKGDDKGGNFSFLNTRIKTNYSCYIAYTNKQVHELLAEGFEESPMFNGTIQSIGPRYCPSIETKLVTFADKDKHQLFLEPEGKRTHEMYLNGFSSSLPWEVQYRALRGIKGFENVKIFRPGYAIEYDYYPPTQLNHTLETKAIRNLYFAGQINGTTGYEEAAGQGLIAGINASLSVLGKEEFVLSRDEAYIGVLIDDLVTKGVDEPYRMFTSRAEHRVLLRQDNADERLTQKAYSIGLADEVRLRILDSKLKKIQNLKTELDNFSIRPDEINEYLISQDTSAIKQQIKLVEIAKRPQINLVDLLNNFPRFVSMFSDIESKEDICEWVEIAIKYSGYVEREKLIADKLKRLENIKIPDSLVFNELKSLSTESRQKLTRIKPTTIGQAGRIPGVSPSDVNVLLVYLGR